MRVVVPPLLRASLALVLALALIAKCSGTMTALELSELRNSTVQLFRHAFGSYMAHAFPMDELLPLSCKGSNSFGGVSVTLIDSLDTLAVMGLREEFAQAVEVCVVLHAMQPRGPVVIPRRLAAGCPRHRHHAQRKHQVPRLLLPLSLSLPACSSCAIRPLRALFILHESQLCNSVFEANIRLLGGLLSAHVLASDENRGLLPG
jgi:hypothetical protein